MPRRQVFLGRGLQHLDAVLVGAGEEEHIAAFEPHEAGDGVGGDRFIGVADMRRAVRICDRGGDVIGLAAFRGHDGLVSTARGLGKQAENVEDQRFALEIVGFGVTRRRIDALPGLGKSRRRSRCRAAGDPAAATARH